MIEWIGIVCCSSVISCICSLFTTGFCLSPTGERLREKLRRRIKVKNQDESPQFSQIPEKKKIYSEDKKTFQGKSLVCNILPETSPYTRSHSGFGENQRRKLTEYESEIGESQSVNIEGQLTSIPKENLKNQSLSSPLNQNPKNFSPDDCEVPTETEIRKTIDNFNAVFKQYNELILKTTKRDFCNKKSQSSAKFNIPNISLKTSNMATMTEPQNFIQVFDAKSKTKIKKCKCKKNKKGLRKNVSTQSFRSVRSCTCTSKKSINDLNPKKIASLKNLKSNSTVRFPRDSKHRLTSKTSWISKTMKRLRLKNERKEKLRCECSNLDEKIHNS